MRWMSCLMASCCTGWSTWIGGRGSTLPKSTRGRETCWTIISILIGGWQKKGGMISWLGFTRFNTRIIELSRRPAADSARGHILGLATFQGLIWMSWWSSWRFTTPLSILKGGGSCMRTFTVICSPTFREGNYWMAFLWDSFSSSKYQVWGNCEPTKFCLPYAIRVSSEYPANFENSINLGSRIEKFLQPSF